jgi:hypothetical protein
VSVVLPARRIAQKRITAKPEKSKKKERIMLCAGIYPAYLILRLKLFPKHGDFPEHEIMRNSA